MKMPLVYSIVGGPDADKFNINSATGELSFKVAPDYENPGSAAGTNDYHVTVGASDGIDTTTQDRVITVTDVNEAPPNAPPVITSPANVSVPENQTTIDSVQAIDPDETTTPPPPSTWPDATNTGTKAALTPHAGSLTITAPGEYDGLDVDGSIVINSSGVVLRNFKCRNLFMGWNGGSAPGAIVEDGTLVGGEWNSVINMIDCHGSTLRRLNISGGENGIWLDANDCLIEDNYIHGASAPGNPSPHIDGIQMHGHRNTIRHNNIDLPGSSSSITGSGHTDNLIEGNRINGGTYTIYFEGGASGNIVVGNEFVSYTYGWIGGQSIAGNSFSNNTHNGEPLALP